MLGSSRSCARRALSSTDDALAGVGEDVLAGLWDFCDAPQMQPRSRRLLNTPQDPMSVVVIAAMTQVDDALSLARQGAAVAAALNASLAAFNVTGVVYADAWVAQRDYSALGDFSLASNVTLIEFERHQCGSTVVCAGRAVWCVRRSRD